MIRAGLCLFVPPLLLIGLFGCAGPAPTASPSATQSPLPVAPLTVAGPGQVPALKGLGKIAFSSFQDGNEEIYSIDGDGTNQHRLTNDAGHDAWPAWSPDGKQITFASDRAGNYDIYVMNADGSNVRRLTTDPADDVQPTWSGDGRQIVFRSARADKGIYTMNADGTGQHLVLKSTDQIFPAWSPDSKQIAVVGTGISVMNSDGANLHQITETGYPGSRPDWSPDGSRLAYVEFAGGGSSEIYIVGADGGTLSKFVINARDPAWSPDGRWIAFVSRQSLFAMDIGGKQMVELAAQASNPSWSR